MNFDLLKKHWKLAAGGLLGLLVLYYLLKNLGGSSAGSSAGSSSVSAPDQVQALSASADLANNQANAGVAIAAYQAGVVNNQTIASLQASQTTTAAQLAATINGQNVDLAKTQDTNATAVQLQQIVSNADVSKTAIEGATYTTINKTNVQAEAQLKNAQLAVVGSQIGALMRTSKHFNSDLTAITPLLTAELGNTGASVAASQTKASADQSNAQKVGAVSGAISSIASGLFTAAAGA